VNFTARELKEGSWELLWWRLPFRDKTNGKETFPGGRYLDAEVVLPGYTTTIDFNMAYNPSCVYNEKLICVLPPKESSLDVEIRAGEKNFR
jgi:uncharacterized protein